MTIKHAWIGYDNIFTRKTSVVTSNGAATGFPASNLKNWYNWQRFKGTAATVFVTVDAGAPVFCNYLALSGFGEGGLQGGNLALQVSNDSTTWTNVVTINVASTEGVTLYNGTYWYDGTRYVSSSVVPIKQNIAVRFTGQTWRYWRVRLAGTVAPPMLGVVGLGRALDFPIGFYADSLKPRWNKDTEVINSISERGAFLGRSIVRSGNKPFSFNVEPVAHDWVDDYWMPFKDHAELLPFFFVWEDDPVDPLTGTFNTRDVLLAWTNGVFPNATVKDRRWASVSLSCEGTLE
jgi:hypothetical protein